MNGHGTGPGVDAKRVKLNSIYSHLEAMSPVEVFHVRDLFLADKSPDKINLGVGGEPLRLYSFIICAYTCR